MALWDKVRPEHEKLARERNENRERKAAEHQRRIDQARSELTISHASKKLRDTFGEEDWIVVDLRPEIERYGRSQCRPEMIVTDENRTVYLAVTRRCNMTHWNLAYPVTVSSGPCHWRLDLDRDDPDAAYIAAETSRRNFRATPDHGWRELDAAREALR